MGEFNRTGTFLNTEQIKEVGEAYRTAQNTPMIALSSAQALSGNDFASRAWKTFHRLLYDYALAEGLPEIQGWYGLDIETGEVLGPDSNHADLPD